MIALDHIIVPVRNARMSAGFYASMLGLRHEGRAGPFEVLRVNEGLTLDLLERAPRDRMHLAFRLPRDVFEDVRRRLERAGVALGNTPFDRNGGKPGLAAGATGMLNALYFDDPDGHNLEIRHA